jgi:hypothetical protein
VFLANDSVKAKRHDTAKHMGGDIRASWRVAHVFGKLFFPAVWTYKAGLDRYSGHRFHYCSVTEHPRSTYPHALQRSTNTRGTVITPTERLAQLVTASP